MENQAKNPSFPDDQPHPGFPAQGWLSWGEEAEGQLGLGSFFITGQDQQVYVNSTLRKWLGIDQDTIAGEEQFWSMLGGLAQEPAQLSEARHLLQANLQQPPQIQFTLRGELDSILSMHLYLQKGPDGLESGYGGILFKRQDILKARADLVKVYNSLLTPARQFSAAVLGNLQALTGNFQTWSPGVLGQILAASRQDLDQICHLIDLGLSYARVIDQTTLHKEDVSLRPLLETIISEQGYQSINLISGLEAAADQLVVKIDRALVKMALRSLLQEILNRNPAGQQLEVRISRGEGSAVLVLEGPRTLPLPGLIGDDLDHKAMEFNPDMFLAKEILQAMGGDLVVESWQSGEGGGLRLEVSLPAAGNQLRQPARQEWRDLLKTGSGRILIAEAQQEYQLALRQSLTDLGYRVDLAMDGSIVLDLVQTNHPDLVILARNLPGMDGLLVTQGIRRWSAVPIIMISTRENMDDLLYAYRLGVDDYLRKPFLIEELLAKVEVFISRQAAAITAITPEIFQEGSIRIDHGARQVWVRGEPVQLTPIEYNLLFYLSRQGKQIIPYEQLLEHVWEGPEKGTRQGLFVHVRRLREKIELDPKNPQIVGNKWGVGYEFNP